MLERPWYQEFISTMIGNILQPHIFQRVNKRSLLTIIYIGSAVYGRSLCNGVTSLKSLLTARAPIPAVSLFKNGEQSEAAMLG